MASVQTRVSLNGNGGDPTATRKPRGANKPKPREFAVAQNGDSFTLSVGGVEIPLDDLDTIKGVIWKAVMQGGVTQVSFTKSA